MRKWWPLIDRLAWTCLFAVMYCAFWWYDPLSWLLVALSIMIMGGVVGIWCEPVPNPLKNKETENV